MIDCGYGKSAGQAMKHILALSIGALIGEGRHQTAEAN